MAHDAIQSRYVYGRGASSSAIGWLFLVSSIIIVNKITFLLQLYIYSAHIVTLNDDAMDVAVINLVLSPPRNRNRNHISSIAESEW